MKAWFGCFATRLDQQAEELLPIPVLEDQVYSTDNFIAEVINGAKLLRHPSCRFAYQVQTENTNFELFINGCEWDIDGVSIELVKLVANKRLLASKDLLPFIENIEDQIFLFELWKLQ